MKKYNVIAIAIIVAVISFHYCKVVYGSQVLARDKQVYRLKVHRIIPVKNIYMIYAKNEFGRIFKMVTEREKADSCDEITIGHSYLFDLCPVIKDSPVVIKEGPLTGIILRRDPHVTGYGMYGVGVSLEGDSITNLFYVNNMKGLCYLGDSLISNED